LDNSRYNVTKTNINVNTDIELLIKAEVFKKQIRIKDFFVDFDRLRRGVVTEDKFRTALSNLNMHMKESDISELVTRYVVGPD
jgi:Ca2+-binding EF-hand superfamily protein